MSAQYVLDLPLSKAFHHLLLYGNTLDRMYEKTYIEDIIPIAPKTIGIIIEYDGWLWQCVLEGGQVVKINYYEIGGKQ